MDDLLWIIGLILFFNFISWLKKLFSGGNIPTRETGEYPATGPHPFRPVPERIDEPAERESMGRTWREAESTPPSGLPPWLVLEDPGEEQPLPQQSRQLPRKRVWLPEFVEQPAGELLPSTPNLEAGSLHLSDSRLQVPDPLGSSRTEQSDISRPASKTMDSRPWAGRVVASKRSLLDLGPDSVARGIIWSEILQTPRCRRPYQWSRAKH
ncbi:MAG: hypothetical protein GX755_08625 [Syntrophomonadaceae bacterium]|nr:hypothetical protein [Syntrophomonadaceae bacterium]